MDFGFDATTEDYRKRLLPFMEAYVYPAEAGWHSDGWAPPAALARLQAAARDAGLWNLFKNLTNVQFLASGYTLTSFEGSTVSTTSIPQLGMPLTAIAGLRVRF